MSLPAALDPMRTALPLKRSDFSTLARQHQDEAYTLAYFLLGDENQAADVTGAALNAAYRQGGRQRDSFRRQLLRGILSACRAAQPAKLPEGLPQRILRLAAEERICLLLADVMGFDYRQAAGLLGMTEKDFAARLAQARAQMLEG